MKWLAPAKINLSLRVLGRREDGFHELETLMAPLSLADEILVEEAAEDALPAGQRFALVCSDPTLSAGPDNLVWRAAELFRQRTQAELPALRVHLTKNIPHGAGLGGGSSDAATILLALNERFAVGWSAGQLAALAAELGSDVPFFVYRSAAVCRGRGEQVEPMAIEPDLSLLLVKPDFPVPTPWAYGRWAGSRELPGVDYGPQAFGWGTLVNDLERPVFEKYLLLAELKTWLREQPGVAGALMSGSGSTMIAVLQPGSDADALRANVIERFGPLWTCCCSTRGGGANGESAGKAAVS